MLEKLLRLIDELAYLLHNTKHNRNLVPTFTKSVQRPLLVDSKTQQ